MLDELIISESVVGQQEEVAQVDPAAKRLRTATYGYALLATALLAGWMSRNDGIVDPSEGTGYWLGITGASLMLLLLLYPLRKKMTWLGVLGSVRGWFRLHIFFGLFGPLLILYHCNFSLGSFNSQVALYSMLVVAGSGIIGLHIYTRIHRGLNGQKFSLQELQDELAESMKANRGMARAMPNLVSTLETMSAELQGDEITRSIGIGRSLKWTVNQVLVRFKLRRIAKMELIYRALHSPVIARDIKRFRFAANQHIDEHVRKMSRVAQFSLYERLFSLWHLFHLPLFLMLILSASVHVLAVHMY